MSTEEAVEEAIRRYPIPAPVDYPTTADYTIHVVFIQGRRQGWIDAHTPNDAAVKTMAKHMSHAALDWIDIEGPDHEHSVECSNWTAYQDDARAALTALLAAATPDYREDAIRGRQ